MQNTLQGSLLTSHNYGDSDVNAALNGFLPPKSDCCGLKALTGTNLMFQKSWDESLSCEETEGFVRLSVCVCVCWADARFTKASTTPRLAARLGFFSHCCTVGNRKSQYYSCSQLRDALKWERSREMECVHKQDGT